MAYKFESIKNIEVINAISENLNLLAEQDGKTVRVTSMAIDKAIEEATRENEWEHIETFTFDESMAFERTQTPNGKPYAYNAISLQIKKPEGIMIPETISIQAIFTKGRISQPLYFVPCTNNAEQWMLSTVENYKGLVRRTRTTGWDIYNSTSAVNEVPFLMYDNALRDGEVIEKISSKQVIPAGLIFELWGGACLMPKININGITREMTQEEVAEMEHLSSLIPEPTPTPDDRLNEIETALIELASLLGGMIE